MTTTEHDAFTDAARAEAVRRAHEQIPGDSIPDFIDRGLVIEFGHQMAEWARAHLAAQEPTDTEHETGDQA